MTPPMMAFFSELRPSDPPPEPLELLRAVSVASPVVCSVVLDPTLVERMVEPLVTISITVVVGTTSVEMRGLVVTDWEGFGVALELLCALSRVMEAEVCVALGDADDGLGAGVGEGEASSDEESSEDGEGAGEGEGEDEGSGSGVGEGSSADEEAGGGFEERVGSDEAAPVPSAYSFLPKTTKKNPPAFAAYTGMTPWWRYALMPSTWRASSTLTAADRATRTSRVKRSHEDRIVLSMFLEDGGGNERSGRAGGASERGYV